MNKQNEMIKVNAYSSEHTRTEITHYRLEDLVVEFMGFFSSSQNLTVKFLSVIRWTR